VSLLPSFALPYRLLNSRVVERFFLGQPLRGPEQRWRALLQSYRQRLRRFGPRLIAHLGLGLGQAPPALAEGDAPLAWLIRLCGGLGPATEQLVNRWAVSPFGFYRCHQRSADGQRFR
jgi:hypothetical protein